MKYPAYPKYKESGVAWLGVVPEHWLTKRLKEVSELFGRIGFRGYSVDDLVDEGEGAISMSPSNMIDGGVDLSKSTWLSWEKYFESPEIQIKPDDIVMVKTGSTIGKTAYVETVAVPMTINPQLMIFKNVKCNNRFLFHYVSSKVIQDVVPLHNTGSTIPTMTQAGIGKLPFPLPPDKEQTAIADFLDRETWRIDTLVAKKRMLLDRLKEKRTALISRTVTRGLPTAIAREFGLEPHTRFKDSGIEWLGEVPEGWEVLRLSYIALLKSGDSITAEQIAEGGDYPVYGGNGLRGYYSQYTHEGTFVLIGRQGALCGNINYSNGQFWASEHAVVVNPLKPFAVKWLGGLLFAMNLNQYSVSAAQPGLSVSQISSLKIPVPLFPEQTAIATYLDRETAKIDRLAAKLESAIARLREYRTALITAAVTGKIDVREMKSKENDA